MIGAIQRKDQERQKAAVLQDAGAPSWRLSSALRQPPQTATCSKSRRCAGFTFTELLVVLTVAGSLLLVGLILLAPADTKKARRINCLNNLKQVGTAFNLWAGDNLAFPTHVPTNRGGASELVGGGEVWLVFRTMSNELNTPKIVLCPSDTRWMAVSFDVLYNTNISYFIGLDAVPERPGSLLTGDRNLEVTGKPASAGQLTLLAGERVGWTKAQHVRCGNIGLADGSVQQLSNAGLQEFFRQQQPATNPHRASMSHPASHRNSCLPAPPPADGDSAHAPADSRAPVADALLLRISVFGFLSDFGFRTSDFPSS
jgi:prepilin-type N-terminal cleavage/methylation domain-containing protein